MHSSSNKVIHLKRNWRSLIPHFVLFLVIVFVGVLVTENVPAATVTLMLPIEGDAVTVDLPIFLLFALIALARPVVLLFDSHYQLSEHHLRINRGQLSIWRRRQEFAFEDLLGVQVSQSLLDRVLGVGTITVGTKTAALDVVMRGLAKPQAVADQVARRIDASRIAGKGGR